MSERALGSQRVIVSASAPSTITPEISKPGIEPNPARARMHQLNSPSGCVVEMLRFPNSPHGGAIEGAPIVRRAQNEALLDWMNRYVLGIEPDQEGKQEGD